MTFLLTGQAEQLPIKIWTAADGLAHNHINRIRRDSRGYLWFCTDEGLSRFDGYQFISYTTAHGLPHRTVNDLLEARDGTYWVATDGGVCRFNPLGSPNAAANPLFTVHRLSERENANHVNTLAEDSFSTAGGALWCATSDGLFRLERAGGQVKIQEVEIGLPRSTSEDTHVSTVIVDRQGAVWAGGGSGLYRRWPDGRVEQLATPNMTPLKNVNTLFEDRDGRLWAGLRQGGLCRLAPDARQPVVGRCYSTQGGLAGNDVRQIFRASDGRLWIATVGGLSELLADDAPPADQVRFVTYTTANGLSSNSVYKLAEDRDGNLWVGTRESGVLRIARAGFTTYSEADGYRPGDEITIVENPAGELCIYSGSTERHFIQRLEGNRFTATKPNLSPRITDVGIGRYQYALQDRLGEWWVPTGQGELYRFPKVSQVEDLARVSPKAVYTTREWLPCGVLRAIYEDRRGDIWMAFDCNFVPALLRWERATGKIYDYAKAAGFARPDGKWPSAFREDAAGNLWIGFRHDRGLARYAAGRFTYFTSADGVPAWTINALHLDASHRLWIATSEGGLGRLDDPAAEHPRFTNYTVAQGLASNEIWSLTEDRWGRIYAGTNRGLDRLDPATGRIRHFTPADGLVRGEVRGAYRDRQGVLWFVTEKGVSRLVPSLDAALSLPPIAISGLRMMGVPQPISAFGETRQDGLEFAPSQNQVQIDFLGLDFSAGAVLRYQYRLEGLDRDWGAPGFERTVNYPNLPPGAYRFAVRAINAEGVTSDPPAMLSFTIRRPVWQRWWFMVLMVGFAVGITYAAYRYRVAQLLEMERVRTRIAADLHDDIGANLTKISILSEVAKQQFSDREQNGDSPLTSIADISRESVAAMSDIVWAINPKKDSLLDLVRRMRQFAEETLLAREIALEFRAPDATHNGGQELKLGADARRQIYLIFKESLNNIVRHAEAQRVEIDLCVEGRWLALRIADDGKGFDTAREYDGNGLLSMKKRAVSFGGELQIDSDAGRGTTVWLRTPLAQKNWLTLRK